MSKRQHRSYELISAISISVILIASFTIAASQFSQQAIAQAQNATKPTPTKPTATKAKSASETTFKEPPLGKSIVWQGTISSVPDPLAPDKKDKAAFILPPRKDHGVYSGFLTFTASKPVQVQLYQLYNIPNTTKIPKEFGSVDTSRMALGAVSTSLIPNDPTASATIPFSANAVALLNSGGKNFIATYSISAQAQKPVEVNHIESIMNATATSNSTTTSSSAK
jgi:hypothetical protein